VAQIVETCQVSESCRYKAFILLIILDTASPNELVKSLGHKVTEILVDCVSNVASDIVLEAIVGWILCEPPEEVSPGQIIYTVLELLQSSTSDFGIDMVSDLASKTGLNREWLI